MLLFRVLLLVLMGAAGLSFLLFAVTGQPKYKRFGVAVLKWTLLSALGFFLILTLDRIW